MSEEPRNQDSKLMVQELDGALNALDVALTDAGRAVSSIRGQISRFVELAQVVEEMEAAMVRVRLNLSASAPTAAPPLRAVPREPDTVQPEQPYGGGFGSSSFEEPGGFSQPVEPAPSQAAYTPAAQPEYAAPSQPEYGAPSQPEFAAPSQPEYAAPSQPEYAPPSQPEYAPPSQPEFAPASQPEFAPASQPEYASPQPVEPAFAGPVSHCLRLGVSSKTGSLDLKAVDGSVNENPAVVDVALLDYDGRQATLKLWINNQADPQGVREALLASLRRRLGDEQDADVHIDFEEGSAA